MNDTTSLPGSDPYRSSGRAPWEEPDLVVPYDGQARMRLVVTSGMSAAHVRVDPDATALLRVDPGAGTRPAIRVAAGEVRLSWSLGLGEWLRTVLAGGPHEMEIVLHPAVAWEIAIRGGLSRLDADLRAGIVSRIEVGGGASDVELELPHPARAVPIRIAGGASHIRLRRPADVGVAVSVTGGASSLRLDDRTIDAIGGPARLETSGPHGESRYEVHVHGGASHVEVDRS